MADENRISPHRTPPSRRRVSSLVPAPRRSMHLGNYDGMNSGWPLQNDPDNECLFFIRICTITVPQDPEELRERLA